MLREIARLDDVIAYGEESGGIKDAGIDPGTYVASCESLNQVRFTAAIAATTTASLFLSPAPYLSMLLLGQP